MTECSDVKETMIKFYTKRLGQLEKKSKTVETETELSMITDEINTMKSHITYLQKVRCSK